MLYAYSTLWFTRSKLLHLRQRILCERDGIDGNILPRSTCHGCFHRTGGSRAVGSNYHAVPTVELKKIAKQKSLRSLEGLNLSHRTNSVLEDIHDCAAATLIRMVFQASKAKALNRPMKTDGAIGVYNPLHHIHFLLRITCFGA